MTLFMTIISWKLGLEGVFFARENNIDMTYKLDKSKKAFILAGTSRHMCGGLNKKKIYIYLWSIFLLDKAMHQLELSQN